MPPGAKLQIPQLDGTLGLFSPVFTLLGAPEWLQSCRLLHDISILQQDHCEQRVGAEMSPDCTNMGRVHLTGESTAAAFLCRFRSSAAMIFKTANSSCQRCAVG